MKFFVYSQFLVIFIFSFILILNKHGFLNFIKQKAYKDFFAVLPVVITIFWIFLIIFYNTNEQFFILFEKYKIEKLNHFIIKIFGVFINFLGLLILWLSYKKLGKQLTLGPNLPNGAILVKDGPYYYSRNPIYLAFLLMYFGIFLLNFNFVFFVFFLLMFFALNYLIKIEERVLERKFKEDYLEYKKRVPRYF